ncbi:hypothetical protein T4B_10577 [Trichinella pseudospiralis]|uniref:Uncharacterized protein n=2 Tax=Trichinella pseudospiralis TaxID=6337 RepID=A0A0V1EK92_TRIPS|nr:hypothetical protein T4A_807 [Trichinella pseudospiralis]KRY81623.1 hypothetical protein T4D_8912 [Trichinella pseudospiralis]KRZ10834.1 hypothetical protein T4B_10577 [Trichinella pseudospiralis]KRZ41702.1 hypothetical protein T4C_877 [Trichinella pseudospiralis]
MLDVFSTVRSIRLPVLRAYIKERVLTPRTTQPTFDQSVYGENIRHGGLYSDHIDQYVNYSEADE